MATATFVPVETYLRSSYEPDAEYVDGEIEERCVSNGKPVELYFGGGAAVARIA